MFIWAGDGSVRKIRSCLLVFPVWHDGRNPAPADALGRNRFIDVFFARGRIP
jgi:hypothetical protein